MTTTLPMIRCGFGLGNRVAAMANALSRFPEGIRFVWRENQHMPLSLREVFPQGVKEVEFLTDAPPVESTRWEGRRAYEWSAAGHRGMANAAYGRIMAAMAGEPRMFPPALAICGRFFRNPECLPEPLANQAIMRASLLGVTRVFVFCDRNRAEIAEHLESAGLCAVLPHAPELRADLERDAAGMLEYLSDWKTLLAASEIIACDGPASALHPARAAGTRILYVGAKAPAGSSIGGSGATAAPTAAYRSWWANK